MTAPYTNWPKGNAIDLAAVVPLVPEDAPAPVRMQLKPEDIRTDPSAYQFRARCNDDGVTELGRIKADKWEPDNHGKHPLILHQRANGDYYVADGHHRLDLAKRTDKLGTGPGKLDALVLRETDGYTAQDVKVIAAYLNLNHDLIHGAHGAAELADGARAIKEAASVAHPKWLPTLKLEGDLHLAHTLSKLTDRSLDLVAQEKVPVEMAALIAETARDPVQQEKSLNYIADRLAANEKVTIKVEGYPARGGEFTPLSDLTPVKRPSRRTDLPNVESWVARVAGRNNPQGLGMIM